MPTPIHLTSLFNKGPLSERLEKILQEMLYEIEGYENDFILSVNDGELFNVLYSKYSIVNPEVNQGAISTDKDRVDVFVPGRHPLYAFISNSVREAICLYLPATGDIEVLRYWPSSRRQYHFDAQIVSGYICLYYIIVNSENKELIKQGLNIILNHFNLNLKHIKKDIDSFNIDLSNNILERIKKKRETVNRQRKINASLGFPVRDRSDLPGTYAEPILQAREDIVVRPSFRDSSQPPDPVIDEQVYQSVLQVTYDTGRFFARLPSLFEGKKENALRDVFLFQLETRFEIPVTGETFHGKGKTDIYLPYQRYKIFLAECKFWKGEKHYLKNDGPIAKRGPISQLLEYAGIYTTKVAVILFVREALSAVIRTVKDVTPNHPHFVAQMNEQDDGWLNYRFRSAKDPEREVRLTVFLFHTPKVDVSDTSDSNEES